MKNRIINILKNEQDPSIRFEVLEKFFEYIYSEEDVLFLMGLLIHDSDPCVRHKAAAQLFRVEEKESPLTVNLKSKIIQALVDRAFHDKSTVVRHESIEALGYLGDKSALDSLKILMGDENLDVSSTAGIAFGTAKRRVENNIDASEVANFLIETSPVL
jgi:hypothetical protein